jgi:hypothetical protein
MARKAKHNRKGKIPGPTKIPVPAKHKGEFHELPPYRPTALPPIVPKHPYHSPTPNRRGR